MKHKLYTNISFKGTTKEKRQIDLAAKLRGMSVGELVRAAVISYAKEDFEKLGIFLADSGSHMNQYGIFISNNEEDSNDNQL